MIRSAIGLESDGSIQHGYARLIVKMDVIQKARERHAQLKAQIEAAEAARPEFERLGAFLAQAEEIERQNWPTVPMAEFQNWKPDRAVVKEMAEKIVRMRSPAFGMDGELTGQMAAKVFDTFGPRMHISAILEHLYAEGWKGSGDKKKDYKNVFQNLSDKPKRFRNLGEATFEKVMEEPKKEQGR